LGKLPLLELPMIMWMLEENEAGPERAFPGAHKQPAVGKCWKHVVKRFYR